MNAFLRILKFGLLTVVLPVLSPAAVYWNFTADTPTSGLPAGVGSAAVVQGNNNGTTTMITSSSASSGYAGASGTFNAGAAARIGALNTAAAGSAYFEVTFDGSAQSLNVAGLSFGSRSTSTGPQAYTIRTSLDGFTGDVASGAIPNNSSWNLYTVTGLSLATPAGQSLTLRIYGHGGSGSPAVNTANWRIDDLSIDLTAGTPAGTVVTLTAPDDAAAEAGADTATFRFTRTGSTTAALVVGYSLGGTASATDYAPALTGSITIPVGLATADLVVTPVDDSDDEGAETLVLTLAGGAGYTVGSPDEATIAIADNDAPPPAGASDVYWNFNTATPTSGLPADVGPAELSQGNNNGTTTLLTTTSASSGYSGVSGSFNAGAAARIGALNTADGGSAYFEVTFDGSVQQVGLAGLSFGSRSTGTGPQAYSIRTSVDGFASDVASGTFLNNSAWAFHTVTGLGVIAPAEQPLTVRIYGHSGAGSPGVNTANWRIDDLTIALTTQPLVLAPGVKIVESGGGTSVVEGGATDTYTVKLITVPAGAVTLTIEAGTQLEVSTDGTNFASTAALVLTDTAPRTITVRAVDDTLAEGPHDATVTHAITATADAAGYPLTLAIANVVAAIQDDDAKTLISSIQGSGIASPFVDQVHTVEAVVTGFFTGSTGAREGFYLQEEDADADPFAETSEGIYVYTAQTPSLSAVVDSLAVGDVALVTAKVAEFNGLTELTTQSVASAGVVKVGTAPLPAATPVSLPAADATALERYEGMRVSFAQELTVSGNFTLGQYGELYLSSGGRLYTPTNVLDVNDNPADGNSFTGISNKPAVDAYVADNLLRMIVLDDASSRTYPWPNPFLNAQLTRRVGDTVTGLTGVLSYGFGTYRVLGVDPVSFADTNPRNAAPSSVGAQTNLRVSSFNVLNYFNGNGAGGGFPTSRGADSLAEFNRQRAKIVAALQALNADVFGLIEIENDGTTAASAIADLVSGLNAAVGAGTYAIAPAPAFTGTDEIKVAFIYKSAVVSPAGAPMTDADAIFDRPPLAQAFTLAANGEKVVVVVNHFKSKGSGNDDGTGQGLANDRRKSQAQRLLTFINGTVIPTAGDTDVLIIGDLNAYAQEDPIDILRAGGFEDQIARFNPGTGYSYSFDAQAGYLDHALASPSLAARITGATEWHINSDEPAYVDYNLENKPSAEQQAMNIGTPYRSSDHDPVLVGMWLGSGGPFGPPPPVVVSDPSPVSATVGDEVTFSVGVTGGAPFTYQWRRNGADLANGGGVSGATTDTLVLTGVLTSDAGNYDVVVGNESGTVASAAAALTVQPAAAAVSFGSLIATYNGVAQPVAVTTVPAALPVTVTYDGATTAPTDAGTYAVEAIVNSPDYVGGASGTYVILKAAATVTLGNLTQAYDESPKSVTVSTLPESLPVTVTYDGGPVAPSAAGSYAVAATVVHANYAGGAAGTLTIVPSDATIVLGDLEQFYDGTPRAVTVTTSPAGLDTVVTYNGSPVPPVYPGTYDVAAAIDDDNHAGTTLGTLRITTTAVVRQAPTINGRVEGSVHVLAAQSVTLNGNSRVSGDLLVPGTPTVRLNGRPTFGGTIDGPGAASPTGHTVTLNGGSLLSQLVRRVDPVALPAVLPPAAPAGTRNVSINKAGDPLGNPATIRNLTLNGNAGEVALPPGNYGTVTVNGNARLVIGSAGSTAPVAYGLQGLTLNGNSELQVVGPVVLTLASTVNLNSRAGAADHPEWLTVRLASGSLTLNGNSSLEGSVVAPSGTVTINGNAHITGSVQSDRLTINGNGLLQQPAP